MLRPISRAIDDWHRARLAVKPPALEAQMNVLEEFAGFALPPDVRAYVRLANGMDSVQRDDCGVSCWSIERILAEGPDARSPGEGCRGHAFIYADVLIYSWFVWI